MNQLVGPMRRQMAAYLKEWTRDEEGDPLSDSAALEIVDNLLNIIKDEL